MDEAGTGRETKIEEGSIEDSLSSDLSQDDSSECKENMYTFLEQRLNSFKDLGKTPHERLLKAITTQLGLCGFYYTGYLDRVKCVYCNLILYNWKKGDDPLVEHAFWNPTCLQPRKLLGDIIMSKIEFIKTFKSLDDMTKKKMMYDLVISPDYNMKCIVCFKDVLGICFLPCRHVKCCSSCGLNMMECPACGKEIEMYIQVTL